jgi:hypothetical protein
MVPLGAEQRALTKESSREILRLVDPDTGQECVRMRAEIYDQVQSLLNDLDPRDFDTVQGWVRESMRVTCHVAKWFPVGAMSENSSRIRCKAGAGGGAMQSKDAMDGPVASLPIGVRVCNS